MLDLNGLKKTYKMGDQIVQALDGVSLRIEAGEFVAIMGPSGSGKSTLMNVIGLLDCPDAGSYQIDGRETSHLPDDELALLRSRSIGFIFQQFNLIPHLSALENVLLPRLYGDKGFDRTAAAALLKKVGLGDRSDHKPVELSGGQQQRVAIARAMINEPLLILADEPTGNLDSRSETEIIDLLKSLNEQGATIVIVTHDEHVGSQAKRLIRMRDGKVLSDERQSESGPPQSIPHAVPKSKNSALAAGRMHFKQALVNLTGNKLRSALSMLGITVGIASVVAMLSLGQAFQNNLKKQLAFMGDNILMITPGRNDGESHNAALNSLKFDYRMGDDLKKGLSDIKHVVGIQMSQANVRIGTKSRDAQILGVSPNYFKAHTTEAKSGYFFDENATADDREAIIGEQLAEELFEEGEDPLGEKLNVNGIEFTIIGVMEKSAMSMLNQGDSLIVPIEVTVRRFVNDPYLSMLEVQPVPGVESSDFEEAVKDELALKFNIPDDLQDKAFTVINTSEMMARADKISSYLKMFLVMIASIALGVGAIGIMNIMLVSVTERTREIGLRKAIGAKRSAIFIQFLIESKMICLFGGFVGIAVAAIFCAIVNYTAEDFPVSVSLPVVIGSSLFSITVGVISGVYPARRAASLNPIDALRSL